MPSLFTVFAVLLGGFLVFAVFFDMALTEYWRTYNTIAEKRPFFIRFRESCQVVLHEMIAFVLSPPV